MTSNCFTISKKYCVKIFVRGSHMEWMEDRLINLLIHWIFSCLIAGMFIRHKLFSFVLFLGVNKVVVLRNGPSVTRGQNGSCMVIAWQNWISASNVRENIRPFYYRFGIEIKGVSIYILTVFRASVRYLSGRVAK
jgi:hypothetical protein